MTGETWWKQDGWGVWKSTLKQKDWTKNVSLLAGVYQTGKETQSAFDYVSFFVNVMLLPCYLKTPSILGAEFKLRMKFKCSLPASSKQTFYLSNYNPVKSFVSTPKNAL
jgi:hypothetical protein